MLPLWVSWKWSLFIHILGFKEEEENMMQRFLRYCAILVGLLGYTIIADAHRSLPMSGRVIDTNGHPIERISVSVFTFADHGAEIITVFTDKLGAFAMPGPVSLNNFEKPPVVARKLGYEQVNRSSEFVGDYEAVFVTLTMNTTSNQAAVAPASAWLTSMDEEKRVLLIQKCATCHQMPAPAVRNYARLIADSAAKIESTDLHQARVQSWDMIQKYMNSLLAEETVQNTHKPIPSAPFDEVHNLPVDKVDSQISEILSEHFVGPMDRITSYDYGAPLLPTPRTVIREYRTNHADTGSGTLLLGSPPRLWVSVGGTGETIFAIDLEAGQPSMFEAPITEPVSMTAHTLQRGTVGNLWITPYLNGFVGLFDPDKEEWIRKWYLKDETGNSIGISSLSVNYKHEVSADDQGRIWFYDINSNSLGSFLPETGDAALFPIPEAAGQQPIQGTKSCALVMSSDGKQVWYGQLEKGVLVMIDTKTHKFKTIPLPGTASGFNQITISDEDVLFAPLFGTGQLLEYDTRTGKQTIHDLPDRASAPQATTFDPGRKVVWITTANGDLVYRFDPRTGGFAVLPLPRRATQLRTIAVDPVSGMLIATYADARATIAAPSMALTIDLGETALQAGPTN